MHEIEGRVACADYGYGARGEGRTVGRGKVVAVLQWGEGGEHGGPGFGAGGLEVDEEVQCLVCGGVEDAVVGLLGGEFCDWVLAMEGV